MYPDSFTNDEEDIQYERSVDNCGGTIADYSLEDWTDDYGYDITDPKHPNHYDICSEISDSYEPF